MEHVLKPKNMDTKETGKQQTAYPRQVCALPAPNMEVEGEPVGRGWSFHGSEMVQSIKSTFPHLPHHMIPAPPTSKSQHAKEWPLPPVFPTFKGWTRWGWPGWPMWYGHTPLHKAHHMVTWMAHPIRGWPTLVMEKRVHAIHVTMHVSESEGMSYTWSVFVVISAFECGTVLTSLGHLGML